MADAQLRIYQLKPGSSDAFVETWRRNVVPLRRQYGFDIAGAWLDEVAERFVWIVSYEGEGTIEDVIAQYDAAPEHAMMSPPPGDFVEEDIDVRLLTTVDF
jgi:hypothetical protein